MGTELPWNRSHSRCISSAPRCAVPNCWPRRSCWKDRHRRGRRRQHEQRSPAVRRHKLSAQRAEKVQDSLMAAWSMLARLSHGHRPTISPITTRSPANRMSGLSSNQRNREATKRVVQDEIVPVEVKTKRPVILVKTASGRIPRSNLSPSSSPFSKKTEP